MTKDEAIKLVKRYAKLHRKDKFYYAFDYAGEHTIDKNGKKKHRRYIANIGNLYVSWKGVLPWPVKPLSLGP